MLLDFSSAYALWWPVFAKVLFVRNLVKFCENKTLAKWQYITLLFTVIDIPVVNF